MDYKFSKHASEMLKERNVSESWVWETVNNPDWDTLGPDENMHYFKVIPESGERVLHAIVNHKVSPKRIVTVFFDRKARRLP